MPESTLSEGGKKPGLKGCPPCDMTLLSDKLSSTHLQDDGGSDLALAPHDLGAEEKEDKDSGFSSEGGVEYNLCDPIDRLALVSDMDRNQPLLEEFGGNKRARDWGKEGEREGVPVKRPSQLLPQQARPPPDNVPYTIQLNSLSPDTPPSISTSQPGTNFQPPVANLQGRFHGLNQTNVGLHTVSVALNQGQNGLHQENGVFNHENTLNQGNGISDRENTLNQGNGILNRENTLNQGNNALNHRNITLNQGNIGLTQGSTILNQRNIVLNQGNVGSFPGNISLSQRNIESPQNDTTRFSYQGKMAEQHRSMVLRQGSMDLAYQQNLISTAGNAVREPASHHQRAPSRRGSSQGRSPAAGMQLPSDVGTDGADVTPDEKNLKIQEIMKDLMSPLHGGAREFTVLPPPASASLTGPAGLTGSSLGTPSPARLTGPPVNSPSPPGLTGPPVSSPSPSGLTGPPVSSPSPSGLTGPPVSSPCPTRPIGPPVSSPSPSGLSPPVSSPQAARLTGPPVSSPSPAGLKGLRVNLPSPTELRGPPVSLQSPAGLLSSSPAGLGVGEEGSSCFAFSTQQRQLSRHATQPPTDRQPAGTPCKGQSLGIPADRTLKGTPANIQPSGIPVNRHLTGTPANIHLTGTPVNIQASGTSSTVQSSRTPATRNLTETPVSMQPAGISDNGQCTGIASHKPATGSLATPQTRSSVSGISPPNRGETGPGCVITIGPPRLDLSMTASAASLATPGPISPQGSSLITARVVGHSQRKSSSDSCSGGMGVKPSWSQPSSTVAGATTCLFSTATGGGMVTWNHTLPPSPLSPPSSSRDGTLANSPPSSASARGLASPPCGAYHFSPGAYSLPPTPDSDCASSRGGDRSPRANRTLDRSQSTLTTPASPPNPISPPDSSHNSQHGSQCVAGSVCSSYTPQLDSHNSSVSLPSRQSLPDNFLCCRDADATCPTIHNGVEVVKVVEEKQEVFVVEDVVDRVCNSLGVWLVDEEGDTFLHYLSGKEDEREAVDYLYRVQHKPGFLSALNARNNSLETPLYCAVCLGRVTLAIHMIQLGASVNIQCGYGAQMHSVLHKAVDAGHLAMVDVLLRSDDINLSAQRGSDQCTPLMAALLKHTPGDSRYSRLDIITRLLEDIERLDLSATEPRSGKTALMMAVETKDVRVLDIMLADLDLDTARHLINMQNRAGNSAVHVAAGLRDVIPGVKERILWKLIQLGGETTRKNNEGDTPKDWARYMIDSVARLR